MITSLSRVALAAGIALSALPATAQAQIWTNWTSGTPSSVTGNLGAIGVSISGAFAGFQLTNGTEGSAQFYLDLENEDPPAFITAYQFLPNYSANRGDKNFWTSMDGSQGAYTQGGLAAPQPMGLIQFIGGGTITITFSSALLNPFIGINSLGHPNGGGGATMTFGPTSTNAALLSSNTNGIDAYWGTGRTCQITNNSLFGEECSGVVGLEGSFTSLTITGTGENWYGFTIGQATVVPEPSSFALMAVGVLGLAAAARRKRNG